MTSCRRLELQRVGDWAAALALTVHELDAQVRDVTRRLEQAWSDGRGDELSDRLHRLSRVLDGEAASATEFGRVVHRVAEASVDVAHDVDVDADDGQSLPDQGVATSGPRLGGTGARRAGDDRGVRIPRLGDPDDAD
jgi:hypothetical protein